MMAGPLQGIRIVEFAGLGPGPFCAMMLADHGAEVIRIDRPGNSLVAAGLPGDALGRSRRSITLNTKNETGLALARQLCKSADAIIEGYRPGVMERLGLGPDVLLGDNPKLVYGRMTGWGQTGPLAQAAGHDINYIALSGVLGTCGRRGEKPVAPVNYLGDFGGGGMMLAFGVVSALLHVRNGGDGQVIDAAMTDGSALLSAMTWSQLNSGLWKDERGVNWLDTGAHFYDTYECADGECISIGAIEPQFYSLLREKAGLTDPAFDAQLDAAKWPELKQRLADIFLTRTRAEWCEIMEGTDVCFAPVLGLNEAREHPHNRARDTFIEVDGHPMPAPSPRYSATKTDPPRPAPLAGADSRSVLEELGYSGAEIDEFRSAGVLG
jgi:alpha-methylacyl-CoA racemase